MLSKRSFHGINVLVLVASSASGAAVTARQLCAELGLSLSYMEGLLRPLREAGLVRACRGPGGGYALAVPAQQLSIWQALSTMDAEPEGNEPAQASALAWPTKLERRYQLEMEQFLSARFIGDLVRPDLLQSQAVQTRSFFRLKPMAPRWVPRAPNSVFQLSQFARMLHA